eukprot:CAMPEP_0168625944 /NCGR_PEP_ID=MMETSP0449_2-20121227/10332_1 /TAXON_ID=1082188 /ORGANISM="Strombidium rassoulzadegani, Strain ras09" /LENGTH=35 /DNA_ID= /DNA_START= /DNA_END= /DNA_ORIENTATION=
MNSPCQTKSGGQVAESAIQTPLKRINLDVEALQRV